MSGLALAVRAGVVGATAGLALACMGAAPGASGAPRPGALRSGAGAVSSRPGAATAPARGRAGWVPVHPPEVISPEVQALREETAKRAALIRAAAKPVLELREEPQGLLSVAFSPDGKTLAGAGGDGVVVLWESETGKVLRKLSKHEGAAIALAWSADGKKLAVGGEDHVLNVWDVATGELLDRHEQVCPVLAVAFMPDGKHVVTLCGSTLRWWEIGTEAQVREVRVTESGTVDEMVGTPEGEVVVSDKEGNVLVFDGGDGTLVGQLARPSTIKVSPAGDPKNWVFALRGLGHSQVLLSDRLGVWVWDWKADRTTPMISAGKASLERTADGEMLVLAWYDSAEIYDAKNGKQVVSLTLKDVYIQGVAASSDGQRVAVASGGKWSSGGAYRLTAGSVVYVFDLKAAAALMAYQRAAAAKAAGAAPGQAVPGRAGR